MGFMILIIGFLSLIVGIITVYSIIQRKHSRILWSGVFIGLLLLSLLLTFALKKDSHHFLYAVGKTILPNLLSGIIIGIIPGVFKIK